MGAIPKIIHMPDSTEAYVTVLEEVCDTLRAGDLALLPAEGLYGLHARAFHGPALERLRAVKAESSARPFILLIGAPGQAGPLVSSFPGEAAALIENVWPGPLTLVLPASDLVPPWLCHEGCVALRCPGHRFLRELVLSLNEPLISTSANRAGASPPVGLNSVSPDVLGACAVAIDAGRLAGESSTVARPEPDGTLTILRPGLWKP